MSRCLLATLVLLTAAPAFADGGPVAVYRGGIAAPAAIPVYRGQAAPPAYLAASPPAVAEQVQAGVHLWRLGPDGGSVCRVRDTADVGRSVVRCIRLPRGAFARE